MTSLITARDIEDAAARGQRWLAVGITSVVTPAARERAKELGLSFTYGAGGPGLGAGVNRTDRTDRTDARVAVTGHRPVRGDQPVAPTQASAPVQPSDFSLQPSTSVAERRGQRAMLDFVAGLKGYGHTAEDMKVYQEREAEFKAIHGRVPADAREALSLISDRMTFRLDYFNHRVSQEMLWRSVIEIIEPQREELTRRLREAEALGPGRVELDPSLSLPAYYTETDFHIMPGSYFKDELAGFIQELGGSIYHGNRFDGDRMQRAIVESLPADFTPTRILDLGCSYGHSTTIWKERFPSAEVTGIDLSAPMLRFAHLRAIERGVDVTFRQRAAEQTGFPAGSFDLVTACIVTHELPPEVIRSVIQEAYRLLQPGGYFLNGDIPPLHSRPSAYGLLRPDWERDNNGEPFMPAALAADLPGMAREVGFNEVHEPGTVHRATGQAFPWITLARK